MALAHSTGGDLALGDQSVNLQLQPVGYYIEKEFEELSEIRSRKQLSLSDEELLKLAHAGGYKQFELAWKVVRYIDSEGHQERRHQQQ